MIMFEITKDAYNCRTLHVLGAKIRLNPIKRLIRKLLRDLKNELLHQELVFSLRQNYSLEKGADTGLLSILADKYGTDKGSLQFDSSIAHAYPDKKRLPHTYTFIYEKLFSSIRHDVKTVFECGLGVPEGHITGHEKTGPSLYLWREYFPNAQIYGADIRKHILFEDERIKTFYLDQTNPEVVKTAFSELGDTKFDIMIDDGLHTAEAAICLYKNCISYLKDSGYYIIEDIQSYDIPVIHEELSKDKSITVNYAIMCTAKYKNNNLIIIQKK